MGVHFVKRPISDSELDPARPEGTEYGKRMGSYDSLL
jgi:hypothetical protein